MSAVRTAPFVSPIQVTLSEKNSPIGRRDDYMQTCESFGDEKQTWVKTFRNANELLTKTEELAKKLGGASDGAKDPAETQS